MSLFQKLTREIFADQRAGRCGLVVGCLMFLQGCSFPHPIQTVYVVKEPPPPRAEVVYGDVYRVRAGTYHGPWGYKPRPSFVQVYPDDVPPTQIIHTPHATIIRPPTKVIVVPGNRKQHRPHEGRPHRERKPFHGGGHHTGRPQDNTKLGIYHHQNSVEAVSEDQVWHDKGVRLHRKPSRIPYPVTSQQSHGAAP